MRIAWATTAGALLLLAACGQGGGVQPRQQQDDATVRAAVKAALADPARAEHRGSDERRKPLELAAFAGVQPGDRLLDLIPGSGYWTRIFSKVVGPEGRVYAIWPEAYARFARRNVTDLQALSGKPEYANITVAVQQSNTLTAPEPLDVVWTSMNYHDYPAEFMGKTDPSVLNKAVFAMLRPGGVYIVIDHEARPGRGMQDVEPLHRIDPETVKQQVTAAGFEYVGASEVMDNPADPKTAAVFDPSVRGRTDKFALKFRRPAAGQ